VNLLLVIGVLVLAAFLIALVWELKEQLEDWWWAKSRGISREEWKRAQREQTNRVGMD